MDRDFTYPAPWLFGMEEWDPPGGPVDSPLPPILHQHNDTTCMAHAARQSLTACLNIYARRNGQPFPPPVSLQQLIDVLARREPIHRTLTNLFDWVKRYGVVAEADYRSYPNNRGRPRSHARRYWFDWDGYDPYYHEFVNNVESHILEHGPVVTEFEVNGSYDPEGGTILYALEGPPYVDCETDRVQGHAVTITGWGRYPTGATVWECKENYGTQAAENGFVSVPQREVNHVYAPTVRERWWDEDHEI